MITDGGSYGRKCFKNNIICFFAILVAAITMFFVTYADSDDTIDLNKQKLTDKGTIYQTKPRIIMMLLLPARL